VKDLTELKKVEDLADKCMKCGFCTFFCPVYQEGRIADKKMDGIKATKADIVVTACPGCMINLIDNALRHQMPQKVYHLLELVENRGP
jgi:glycolate oxidase iron-sulfur subunit